jgi:hypothetical protein
MTGTDVLLPRAPAIARRHRAPSVPCWPSGLELATYRVRSRRTPALNLLWLLGFAAEMFSAGLAFPDSFCPSQPGSGQRTVALAVCVKLVRGISQTDLRYLSGVGTGFLLPNSALAFTDNSCGRGQLRLDLHEIVPAPSTINGRPNPVKQLVFHRGGSGYVDSQNVRYGQVSTSDLSQGTTWLSRHVKPPGDNRGEACTTSYKVSVQPIPYRRSTRARRWSPTATTRGRAICTTATPPPSRATRALRST